jgi:hypothetical protein
VEQEKKFAVIELPHLEWPATLEVSSKRFRLLVAADVNGASTQAISDFALSALKRGMIYFCSWGPGCERFHDVVDELIIGDDLSDQEFAGPSRSDVVMTTWHDDKTLEEALDFLATCAVPTDAFAPDSDFRLVISVANQQWAAQAQKFLESVKFFI